ncbi:HlyD family type I secretion periplasmic adaptor subunit [Youhaiella tibetensis]|uniref:Membrane fusion protein (MFP) family protein n=1 Tax=Paradevosia tibetensis TaxID=1447062 RepID=A0A5B9DN37_9HYPH|nr:HlyD family type I secretion periplasmic adaptor subunit [Youhaiella tibetensis]QEE20791.1 HlyD family type I secretion periplasmic adaptor subunit [Youhaiella tibetensis]GGF20971.1 HlyD family type I secretion periplasmic adaptor subunit [Youhaiella tibetensis]
MNKPTGSFEELLASVPEQDRPPRTWVYVILLVCGFLAAALTWASLAQIDEISRAEGRVIPSSKMQVIQSAEAGVVTEILVRTGEQVKKGQQLIQLDDTTTASSAGEVEAKVNALQAQVARLRIEYEGNSADGFVCPPDVLAAAPAVCDNEADLLKARQQTLDQGKQVLLQRVEQRQRELSEALANQSRLTDANRQAAEKLALVEPMAKKNLVSQTDLINAQRDVTDTKGQLEAVVESIGRLNAAVAEAQLQVKQADLQFRQDALTDLTTRLAELASAQQTLRGAADRVSRTDIRSPVDGIVNNMAVNTIGAFVSPGERLVDIVPVEDTLLVEAKLKPSDVAFILPGQPANIKITAYDFSIFGGLRGEVQNVSADSIVDPDTRETYYLVLIKTDQSALEYNGKKLPILPGMVSSVEILTGKKTILQYLMKPINKARDEALRER